LHLQSLGASQIARGLRFGVVVLIPVTILAFVFLDEGLDGFDQLILLARDTWEECVSEFFPSGDGFLPDH
jgi:hypothetical protein